MYRPGNGKSLHSLALNRVRQVQIPFERMRLPGFRERAYEFFQQDEVLGRIHSEAYVRPPIFDVIQRAGGISEREMACTFNMGLGFVVIVDRGVSHTAIEEAGFIEVGEVIAGDPGVELGYARTK